MPRGVFLAGKCGLWSLALSNVCGGRDARGKKLKAFGKERTCIGRPGGERGWLSNRGKRLPYSDQRRQEGTLLPVGEGRESRGEV